MRQPKLKKIASQPSWVVRTKNMEMAVTELGGHMAPVTFCRDTKIPFQPYYISPWQDEGLKIDDPVLRPLRGDFFCAPFGANAKAYRGELHGIHGQPAWSKWSFVDLAKNGGVSSLVLRMKTTIRKGTITKKLSLVEGQNVVYSQHVLEGYSGRMPMGHHPSLALPDKENAFLVATSAFTLGMVCPTVTGNPADGGYQALAVGKRFRDLARVPTLFKDPATTDCTAFPARKGFGDILAVFKKASKTPAWTAATNTQENYLWFSLKTPDVLPATVFWISNHNLHMSPWNGRNCCLGLEDVCGYFAEGLADSVKKNPINEAGIATAVALSAKKPTTINYIQGATKVPRGFGKVKAVEFVAGGVTFVSESGKKVDVEVNHDFLQTGEPS